MPPHLLALVMSASLGALIGLIRQWHEQQEDHARVGRTDEAERAFDFGGLRTHTLWAALGCLGALASSHQATFVLPVLLAAVAAQLIVLRGPGPCARPAGSTTLAAALLTVLVGALVAWEQLPAAVVAAAVTSVVIGLKQPLHSFTRQFTREDVRATLQFIAITGVILPLVPNRPMGPHGAFNPYSTWLLVVLISGLGFAGYVAMRLLGARAGLLLTSLLGGLASSTASTLAFSRRSREDPALSAECALAVVIACTVMLPRVLAAIAIIDPVLAQALIGPFAIITVPGVGFGAWLWWQRRWAAHEAALASPEIRNPLSLRTAIKFGLLYAIIAFAVKLATASGIKGGLLTLAFVSGLTDMDAISLSMAENQRSGAIPLRLAMQGVIIGAAANSLLKAGLAISLGSLALRRQVAVVLGATAAVSGAVAWSL